MTDQYVPDDVRDFIHKHIDSVAQIEALLLIRSHSQQQWSIRQIAARLYISESEAKQTLECLVLPDCSIARRRSIDLNVFRPRQLL